MSNTRDLAVLILRTLTRMVEGGERSEQDAGINNPLAQVRRKDVHIVLPLRVLEAQRRYQGVAKHHEEGPDPHKSHQLPPPRHYDASDQTANRRGQRRNCQSSPCSRRGIEQNDLEEEGQVEQILQRMVSISPKHTGSVM